MRKYILGLLSVVVLTIVTFGWLYVNVTLASSERVTRANPKVVVIDRFEGKKALVELPNKKIVSVAKELLPDGVQEGDVIRIEVDPEETLKKRHHANDLLDDFWKK